MVSAAGKIRRLLAVEMNGPGVHVSTGYVASHIANGIQGMLAGVVTSDQAGLQVHAIPILQWILQSHKVSY